MAGGLENRRIRGALLVIGGVAAIALAGELRVASKPAYAMQNLTFCRVEGTATCPRIARGERAWLRPYAGSGDIARLSLADAPGCVARSMNFSARPRPAARKVPQYSEIQIGRVSGGRRREYLVVRSEPDPAEDRYIVEELRSTAGVEPIALVTGADKMDWLEVRMRTGEIRYIKFNRLELIAPGRFASPYLVRDALPKSLSEDC